MHLSSPWKNVKENILSTSILQKPSPQQFSGHELVAAAIPISNECSIKSLFFTRLFQIDNPNPQNGSHSAMTVNEHYTQLVLTK